MRKRTTPIASVAFAAALSALAPACGNDKAPTGPPTPPPVAAAPTPAPSGTPTAQGCRLPAMPECAFRGEGCCEQLYDKFGELVELSIRRLQAEQPALFDGDKLRDPGEADYVVQQIARILETRYNLCAKPGDPTPDEVAVKSTNEFSEQFDVIIGDGSAVNVHGYQVTCRPARF